MPPRNPQEVICHGDYAPYNVVLKGKRVLGIIDFDTCHPGPRVWDIAYALYRWASFTHPDNKDGFGILENQIRRARLFCQAYGILAEERFNLAKIIVERLQTLINFMFSEAEKGNFEMKANIHNEHHILYLRDIEYIKQNTSQIRKELTF